MSYKPVIWKNFDNSFESDTYWYKMTNTDTWDALAQSIQSIPRHEPTVGIKVLNTFTPNTYEYAAGISKKPYNQVLSYADLDAGFIFKTGNAPSVSVVLNGNIVGNPISGLGKVYEIIGNALGNFEYMVDGVKIFETGYLRNSFPMYVYAFGKNNTDYGVRIYINDDGVDNPEIIDITPNLYQKVPVNDTIGFNFSRPMKTASINENNFKLVDENGVPANYSISIDAKTLTYVEINLKEPLKHDTIYELTITDTIYDLDGVSFDGKFIRFVTVAEDVLPEDYGIDLNTNPNDVYLKACKLYELLDIDTVFSEAGEVFNFYYKPTSYNGDTKEYSIEHDKSYQIYDNKTVFEDLYRKQFMPEFESYFDTIGSIGELEQSELSKLKTILLRNITNVNSFKGTKTELDFVVSIFAEAIGYHMVSCDPDPYNSFMYRISTDLPIEYWNKDIRDTSHPNSWKDVYIHIKKQLLDNYQERMSNVNHFYSNFSERVKIGMMEIGYLKPVTDSNTFGQVYTFNHAGNLRSGDLLAHEKCPFKHSSYKASVHYDSIEMKKELFDPSQYVLIQTKPYANDKPVYELEFKQAGIATEYIWEFWFNGCKKFTKKTNIPKLVVNERSMKFDQSYEVRLFLKNKNWKMQVDSYWLIPFKHQRHRNEFESQSFKFLDVGISESSNRFQQYSFKSFLSGHKLKPTRLYSNALYLHEDMNLNELITELESEANFEILPSVGFTALKYMMAGVATKYVWNVFDVNNRKIHEIVTVLPQLDFYFPKTRSYTVKLTLVNKDWKHELSHIFDMTVL